jgi:hypothetical protein
MGVFMSFLWNWTWEILLALIMVSVAAATYSFSQNRQLAYAPCLAKVMTALRDDPAAAVLTKASVTSLPEAMDCAVSEDVARSANQAITDMLVADKTLFTRLPKLLADAGMACRTDKHSIVCDCKSSGPFAIKDPSEECRSLIDLPLPLKRALSVSATQQPAVSRPNFKRPVTYIVRVAYATTMFEPEATPLPQVEDDEGPPVMTQVTSGGVQW